MNTNTTPTPQAGIDLDKLEALARAATPQNLDSAEDSSRPTGHIECPECGGEGTVELTADYCNYDGKAMGVQFYGIGPEHRAAEAFFRAANPATVLALIELARRSSTPAGSGADERAPYIPRNFTTHRAAWREAITFARDASMGDGAAYWEHELAAFDRSFARLLDNPEPIRAAQAQPASQQGEPVADKWAMLRVARKHAIVSGENLGLGDRYTFGADSLFSFFKEAIAAPVSAQPANQGAEQSAGQQAAAEDASQFTFRIMTKLDEYGMAVRDDNDDWRSKVRSEIFDAVYDRAALAQPSAGAQGDERAMFEAWASDPIRAEKLPLDRWPTNDGYKDTRTYTAFYGWKAGRASLAAAPAAPAAPLEYRTCCDHPDCSRCAGHGGFYRMTVPAAPQGDDLPPDVEFKQLADATLQATTNVARNEALRGMAALFDKRTPAALHQQEGAQGDAIYQAWTFGVGGWRDVSKAAYDATPTNYRRILAAPAAQLAGAQPVADDWQSGPVPEGSAFYAYHPALVHADFNPWGVVEAVFNGEEVVGAVWNGCQDCWDTLPIEVDLWKHISGPARAALSASQSTGGEGERDGGVA